MLRPQVRLLVQRRLLGSWLLLLRLLRRSLGGGDDVYFIPWVFWSFLDAWL
jgi:hypothetical protein